MKKIVRLALPLAVLLAPALAFAQGYVQTQGYTTGFVSSSGGFFGGFGGFVGSCSTTLCGIASMAIYLINNILVPLLFAVAFIVFLYGVARAYIFSSGEPEEVSKGHRLILWGIIAFAVMISLWGLVNVVANTFGLTGYYAPPPPYSPYMTGGSTSGQQQYIECPKKPDGTCL